MTLGAGGRAKDVQKPRSSNVYPRTSIEDGGLASQILVWAPGPECAAGGGNRRRTYEDRKSTKDLPILDPRSSSVPPEEGGGPSRPVEQLGFLTMHHVLLKPSHAGVGHPRTWPAPSTLTPSVLPPDAIDDDEVPVSRGTRHLSNPYLLHGKTSPTRYVE